MKSKELIQKELEEIHEKIKDGLIEDQTITSGDITLGTYLLYILQVLMDIRQLLQEQERVVMP
jgi:hypothetical protein